MFRLTRFWIREIQTSEVPLGGHIHVVTYLAIHFRTQFNFADPNAH